MATPRHQISTQHTKTGSINVQTDRQYLEERFQKKPAFNTDIASSTNGPTIKVIANKDFEILGAGPAGTNDVAFATGGGIKCTTDGTTADSTIILPHLDTNQTSWTTTLWNTGNKPSWGCIITTDSLITNTTIWCGLKLSNVSTTATDNDGAWFRYSSASNDGRWECITNDDARSTDDEVIDTGITVATSTTYKMEVQLDSSSVPTFYINGRDVATGTALNTSVNLIPYIGVLQVAGTAKSLYIRRTWISQEYPTDS